jgi:hypothetical protein
LVATIPFSLFQANNTGIFSFLFSNQGLRMEKEPSGVG